MKIQHCASAPARVARPVVQILALALIFLSPRLFGCSSGLQTAPIGSIWADTTTLAVGQSDNVYTNATAGNSQPDSAVTLIEVADANGNDLVDSSNGSYNGSYLAYNFTPSSPGSYTFYGFAYIGGATEYPYVVGTITINVSPATVAAPTFSVGGGSYSSAQAIAIGDATGGATIVYTTDGTAPSENNGQVYSGPIQISTTTMLQAMAYEAGDYDSGVTSATYTFAVQQQPQVVPFYWFNNSISNYYTTNANPGSPWTLAGLQCYVSLSQTQGAMPLYEFYFSGGMFDGTEFLYSGHYYTMDYSQAAGLSSLGYAYEGIACYIWPSQSSLPGLVPLYQYNFPSSGNSPSLNAVHYYGIDTTVTGWVNQGVVGYVYPTTTSVIWASAGTNGVIYPSGQIMVPQGTSETFTITPDTGYYVSVVTVDGVNVTPAKNYTFTDVQSSHTIRVQFSNTPPSGKTSSSTTTSSPPVTSNAGSAGGAIQTLVNAMTPVPGAPSWLQETGLNAPSTDGNNGDAPPSASTGPSTLIQDIKGIAKAITDMANDSILTGVTTNMVNASTLDVGAGNGLVFVVGGASDVVYVSDASSITASNPLGDQNSQIPCNVTTDGISTTTTFQYTDPNTGIAQNWTVNSGAYGAFDSVPPSSSVSYTLPDYDTVTYNSGGTGSITTSGPNSLTYNILVSNPIGASATIQISSPSGSQVYSYTFDSDGSYEITTTDSLNNYIVADFNGSNVLTGGSVVGPNTNNDIVNISIAPGSSTITATDQATGATMSQPIDAQGNLVSGTYNITDQGGNVIGSSTTAPTYDANGVQNGTYTTILDANQNIEGSLGTTVNYDSNGNPISVTTTVYDSQGNEIGSTTTAVGGSVLDGGTITDEWGSTTTLSGLELPGSWAGFSLPVTDSNSGSGGSGNGGGVIDPDE